MCPANNTFPANNSTSAVSPSEVKPTTEARPEVIKYASLGTLPAAYNTVRREESQESNANAAAPGSPRRAKPIEDFPAR